MQEKLFLDGLKSYVTRHPFKELFITLRRFVMQTNVAIKATDLLEYAFCPRFIFFENFLEIPEHQEKRFKVQKGRTVHEERQQINPEYLRKKIGCVQRYISVRLYDQQGLFSGEVDEVLILEDGTAAPLDYKWAEWGGTIFESYVLQLTFYSRLIVKNFQLPVLRGFLVYVRSQHRLVTFEIQEQHQQFLDRAMGDIQKILSSGWFPPPTPHSRSCYDCCYRNICEQY